MYLKVYNDNGELTQHKISRELCTKSELKNKVSSISSPSKEQDALRIFESYFSNAKSILYDFNNKGLVEKLNQLNISKFGSACNSRTVFDDKDFSFICFTSGTTGGGVAALKTLNNIKSEVNAQSQLFKKYNIKQVIVTVPFIHIYGFLTGLLYPYLNNIDIILKEHFMPNDLLDMCEENSLIVTIPTYIKALNKISSKKNLSKCLFVSSTSALDSNEAKQFNEKFSCDIIQLFGSTETGGIAYKVNDEQLWTPLKDVTISTNESSELKVKSPYVSKTIFGTDFQNINDELQTFDYIEKVNDKFRLVGRNSQIFKIAGKRYSTIEIERILESQEGVKHALVSVKKDPSSLRDERLDIVLESNKCISSKQVNKILQAKLSNLKFAIDLKYVDKMSVSGVGKKIRI